MQNQRGFIGVGVLIVVLVGLAVVGGGTYYVAHRQPSAQTISRTENLNTLQPTPTNSQTVSSKPSTRDTLYVDAQGNVQIPESIRLAGEDKFRVFTLEQIFFGLKQYHIDYGTYPAALQNLVDGDYGRIKYYDSETNDAVMYLGNKVAQDKFFAGVRYVVSSDRQHYVISIALEIPKDQNTFKPQMSSKPMISAGGTILGVQCSDKRTFCLRDEATSQSDQTEEVVVNGPTSLAVGQTGTWSASASQAIRFAVIWADGSPVSVNEGSGIPNDTEFISSQNLTHAFSKPGTYYVQFFMKSSLGKVDVQGLNITVR